MQDISVLETSTGVAPVSVDLTKEINRRTERLSKVLALWCLETESWLSENSSAIEQDQAGKECLIQAFQVYANILLNLAQKADGR